MEKTESKKCLSCEKPIQGRADKKFCDDYCRNNYNNTLNADTNNFVRNVINTLRKNRRILEDLIPEKEETGKTTKDKLLQKGFQFQFVTETYTTKKGDIYFYCFEYGYRFLESDWVMVVRRKS